MQCLDGLFKINNIFLAGTWQISLNRRRFFDELAHEKGFNPLDVGRWYRISLDEILEKRVCETSLPLDNDCNFQSAEHILMYHGGSYMKALIDLYPELHLERTKFQDAASTFDLFQERETVVTQVAFQAELGGILRTKESSLIDLLMKKDLSRCKQTSGTT
jgi:hypothetical protein